MRKDDGEGFRALCHSWSKRGFAECDWVADRIHLSEFAVLTMEVLVGELSLKPELASSSSNALEVEVLFKWKSWTNQDSTRELSTSFGVEAGACCFLVYRQHHG